MPTYGDSRPEPWPGLAEIDVRIGKALDVLDLKRTSLEEIREYAEELARTAERLYGAEPRRVVETCPCCATATDDAAILATVYGVAYRRCTRCGHGFVREQPAIEAMDRRFAESEELAATYVDADSVEARLDQVVRPKIAWTMETFRRRVGREPAHAVDVGAGGGHFVAELVRLGVPATGYELSRSARTFAKEAFGLQLEEDFFGAHVEADLVTFWGLLEYTPEPERFLRAARELLEPGAGLLVVEVPRADSLSTAVQRSMPELVARHLDPTSHLNVFSDASLAVALERAGFEPVAAWYFGMDAYELAVQLGLRLGEDHLPALMQALLPLQLPLDEARYCDDIVVAAVPVP